MSEEHPPYTTLSGTHAEDYTVSALAGTGFRIESFINGLKLSDSDAHSRSEATLLLKHFVDGSVLLSAAPQEAGVYMYQLWTRQPNGQEKLDVTVQVIFSPPLKAEL